MNPYDSDLLLRFLDGTLSSQETAALRRRLDASAELRAELKEVQAVRSLLRTTVQASTEQALNPFFTDRLLRRLEQMSSRARRSSEEELFAVLVGLFRPVAVAGLILIMIFAAYSLSVASEYPVEPSPTEAVLGLPPVSLVTAYDVEDY